MGPAHAWLRRLRHDVAQSCQRSGCSRGGDLLNITVGCRAEVRLRGDLVAVTVRRNRAHVARQVALRAQPLSPSSP
ncbi:hypothetical protein ODZ83_09570 [Acaricomes phytoseiuli]|uniref:hypothetical protein n=1 Tax=Acaricomes phytoseiuli TaxID=291968 RepID=UPI0012EA48D6|nr:hypothetical protein [Acaricomes phytoseiuli]MCW1250422.1 hypothetical protein [Acaricomes phytoseiuli]